VRATAALARAVNIPVIASGGCRVLRTWSFAGGGEPNIEGVVIGRALYDGRIGAKAALALVNSVGNSEEA